MKKKGAKKQGATSAKNKVIAVTALITVVFIMLAISILAVRKEGITLLTGNAVSPLLPDEETQSKPSAADEKDECAAIICSMDDEEIYCNKQMPECEEKYSGCRKVYCASQEPTGASVETDVVEEAVEDVSDSEADNEYDSEYDNYDYGTVEGNPEVQPAEDANYEDANDDTCTEQYNDCMDGNTPITCKGDLAQCSESFSGCVCGSAVSSEESVARPDVTAENDQPCSTSVFVCKRQVLTMDGALADSTVECKSDFVTCSKIYGSCVCGSANHTRFEAQYVGMANYTEPDGRCTKKMNTCKKENGIWITCDGTFDSCSGRYIECRCGITATSYT